MADPLSVTAGAVGILSFGLQVCGGIISYYESWKASDQDVHKIYTKSIDLLHLLGSLVKIIQTNTISPVVATQISQPLQSCKDAVFKLDAMVQELQNTGEPATLSARLKAHGKRALYPFRKQTLSDMMAHLEGLQLNLNTALSVANIYQGSEILTLVTQIKSETESSSNLITRLDTQEALINNLGPHGLIAQPAAFRDIWNEHEALLQLPEATRQALAGSCTCPFLSPVKGISRDVSPRIHTPSSRRHLQSCIYYSAAREQKLVRKKLQYCSKRLKFSLTFMVNLSSGAGGFSIGSSLDFHAIVPSNSASFQGLYGIGGKSNWDIIIPEHITKLQRLFREEKAKATDTGDNGYTLLHMACSRVGCVYSIQNRQQYSYLYLLITFLLECGAQVNTFNDQGQSVLDGLIYSLRESQEFLPLIHRFIDQGALITEKALSPLNKAPVKSLLLKRDEAFEISDLARCIILERAEALRNLLSCGLATSNDLIGKFSPLQLAVGWPEGLEILLEAGADARRPPLHTYVAPGGMSVFPLSSLEWAICINCTFSAKVLLKAGIPCGAESLTYSYHEDMEELLIEELVSRRRELKDQGRLFLSQDQQHGMGFLEEDRLPDSHACTLYQALLAGGAAVKAALDPRIPYFTYAMDRADYRDKKFSPVDVQMYYKMIFHEISLTSGQMQKLYRAGFRDCCSQNEFNRTPFTYHGERHSVPKLISRAMWLFSAGQHSFQDLSDQVQRGLRCFIAALVDTNWAIFETVHLHHRSDLHEIFKELEPPKKEFLAKALSTTHTDTCSCACSPGGCSVLSTALRVILPRHDSPRQEAIYSGLKNLRVILNSFNYSTTMCYSIIRSLTFHDLQLTHTCCRYATEWDHYPVPIDPEEAHRIQSEEEDLLHELDKLVSEFQTTYDQLSLSLPEYLIQHWSKDMKDYLLQGGESLSTDLQTCQEMGVYLTPYVFPIQNSICFLLQDRVEGDESHDSKEDTSGK
ncbi:hypothetical protein FE257_003062 [Aspergillus nanangensis]|uniref:Fungal N-terminal domain-containing protein n=1 Tax=Aspergillus nanangensis TaxID=2582783 RepID=A0AAD4GPS9_ASPNN|nr:hypothetical protein FE257_003062 [Aspergillus nanangensis]